MNRLNEQNKTYEDQIQRMKENHEKIMTVVQFVHHYPTIREMLESEGIENVLSKGLTIEEGIESYYAINTYKERVKSFGIYAIGIKVIE